MVAALHETKWFGDYVGGNIVLAAGQLMPGNGQTR